MNKIERIRAVMDGRVPDRIPIMTHNFLMAAVSDLGRIISR